MNSASSHNNANSNAWITKAIVYSLAILLAGSAVLFWLIYRPPALNSTSIQNFNERRDYQQTPFDELDAMQICQYQTRDTHGDMLVTSYVDNHSSRYDPDTGIYKIFLKAIIGEAREHDEAHIHCYIDPELHLVAHYKTVFPNKRSIMKRALSFFK